MLKGMNTSLPDSGFFFHSWNPEQPILAITIISFMGYRKWHKHKYINAGINEDECILEIKLSFFIHLFIYALFVPLYNVMTPVVFEKWFIMTSTRDSLWLVGHYQEAMRWLLTVPL